MKITVLGSASATVVPHRNSSSYFIETCKGSSYLIDAGDGVSRQLVEYKKNLKSINAVFISHTHADHASGIFMLIQSMQQIERSADLEIYLPEELLTEFETILPYFQIYREKLNFKVILKKISNTVFFCDDSFRIEGFKNSHLNKNLKAAAEYGLKIGSYSFRIFYNEKTLLYTSDINDFSHFSIGSDDVHLLISECAHISISTIVKFALQKNIFRIVLSHIPPELENKDISSIKNSAWKNLKIEFAEDGMIIEV